MSFKAYISDYVMVGGLYKTRKKHRQYSRYIYKDTGIFPIIIGILNHRAVFVVLEKNVHKHFIKILYKNRVGYIADSINNKDDFMHTFEVLL